MTKQIYVVQIGYDYYEIGISEITPLLSATRSLKKLKHNPDYLSVTYADLNELPIAEVRARTLNTDWQPPPAEEKSTESDESETPTPSANITALR